MLAAEFAVLVHLKSVGVVLFVFLCVVVSLLALAARQCNLNSHFGTSWLDYAGNLSRTLELRMRRCHMAANTVYAYLPPDGRFVRAYIAAKYAQKKNPLAEVILFYHRAGELSRVFR